VLRVENYLKVRPEVARGDSELAADVRAALARDALLEEDEITAAVDGGQVRLSGTVISPFERAHAADVVARVNGVTNVVNGLRITYDEHAYAYGFDDWDPSLYDYDYDRNAEYTRVYGKSDAEIEEDIANELFWSPYVDADEVRVSVEDGAATLRGRVDDLYEYRKAAENALEGGAYRVRNELAIGP
jgi:osmotically-inducible protein OsmY